MLQSGQSALSIAHRMGFLSVVEILRTITKVDVPTSEVDDGYNIVYPEGMLEAPMDSDEEGGEFLTVISDSIYWCLLSGSGQYCGQFVHSHL